MLIEVGSPASLPLGFLRTSANATRLLGLTVQHPPVDVFAEAAPQLSVTGALAHKGYVYAQRFLEHHGLPQRGNVEIELSIPDMMGLGAEAMLGLSIARTLAWVNGLPVDDAHALARAIGLGPEHALETWGFRQGGLLLADADDLNASPRRLPIAHDDQRAWSFVFILPRVAPDASEVLEAEQRRCVLEAARRASVETETLVERELWPAAERDDLPAFARALMALQQLNRQALADAGTPVRFTPDEQAVLDLFRDQGALAWGRSLTGMALYAVVEGAPASIDLRRHLSRLVGIHGGWVMATITDNAGARQALHEVRPAD